jgi:hypothetical protein
MDTTITYDEVATVVGVNIPLLEPPPNIERICLLQRHFEQAPQCLTCPQSTLHGWKRMEIAREIYALLTPTAFRLPNNPGNVAFYIRPILISQAVNSMSLTRMEQVTFATQFTHKKHYFLSMRNIERACFTPLDTSINDAFKVLNFPTIQGWPPGMRVLNIINQLSSIDSQPMPVVLQRCHT